MLWYTINFIAIVKFTMEVHSKICTSIILYKRIYYMFKILYLTSLFEE